MTDNPNLWPLASHDDGRSPPRMEDIISLRFDPREQKLFLLLNAHKAMTRLVGDVGCPVVRESVEAYADRALADGIAALEGEQRG